MGVSQAQKTEQSGDRYALHSVCLQISFLTSSLLIRHTGSVIICYVVFMEIPWHVLIESWLIRLTKSPFIYVHKTRRFWRMWKLKKLTFKSKLDWSSVEHQSRIKVSHTHPAAAFSFDFRSLPEFFGRLIVKDWLVISMRQDETSLEKLSFWEYDPPS